MGRLRESIRDRVSDYSAVDAAENILSFRRPLYSAKDFTKSPGAAAMELVNQAAEHIKNVDDHAAERHARAETLVKQAIEQLKIAHVRVQSADKLEKECSVKVQDAEKLLEQASSRIAAVEAELSAAKQRAKAAERRANEAENALKHIEEALRTRIVEKIPGPISISQVATLRRNQK